MNHFLHGVVRALAETFEPAGPVLEVGAFQVAGQEALGNLRSFFPGRDYLGLDMRPGPGVDRVGNVESLPFPDETFGTVLALNTFEHVRCFWRGFDEVRRVLRPDGVLIVSCPFFFRIHNYPEDYWRFTPAAFESLLDPYPSKVLGWHGPRARPLHVWALACRERHPPVTDAQMARYQTLLRKYAHEPATSWTRRLRYRLAQLLCGRGPFASYLDRNRWETECLNDPVQSYRLNSPRLDAPVACPRR